ncbi:hypothetical protein J2Z66_007253 [Paenibacillus eucommiae]|uniref:Uncharacterized protein n=1 Tax=Paenibacillus eucommiae TaxID=1355755 RepID=A0ABS4J8M2_9BACL|nr:hypothetical protein [Paenibacillus eucommiae]
MCGLSPLKLIVISGSAQEGEQLGELRGAFSEIFSEIRV